MSSVWKFCTSLVICDSGHFLRRGKKLWPWITHGPTYSNWQIYDVHVNFSQYFTKPPSTYSMQNSFSSHFFPGFQFCKLLIPFPQWFSFAASWGAVAFFAAPQLQMMTSNHGWEFTALCRSQQSCSESRCKGNRHLQLTFKPDTGLSAKKKNNSLCPFKLECLLISGAHLHSPRHHQWDCWAKADETNEQKTVIVWKWVKKNKKCHPLLFALPN